MDEYILSKHVIQYDKDLLAVGQSSDPKETKMILYDQQKNEWTNIESPLNGVNNECLAWISKTVLSSLTETPEKL